MQAPDPSLSAQVVLRPRGGDRGSPITVETLADHAPDPRAAETVATHFRDAGFEVGELVAISFAITAPRTRFETVFGVHVDVEQDAGGQVVDARPDGAGWELPLSQLPGHVTEHLRAVTFTPPPDFGPGSFA